MKRTKQFIQSDYPLDPAIFPPISETWKAETHGCGYCSLANCLVNLGFGVDPIIAAKKIFLDADGKLDRTYLVGNGIKYEGLIYALDRFINEDNFSLEYYRSVVDFDNPESNRMELINNLNNGYLAIIQIGPEEVPGQPLLGHYSVISDVSEDEKFYIIDSDANMAHTHMTTPISFDFILKSMYGKRHKLNFLFVRVKKKILVPGSMKGKIVMAEDFDAPLDDFEQ